LPWGLWITFGEEIKKFFDLKIKKVPFYSGDVFGFELLFYPLNKRPTAGE